MLGRANTVSSPSMLLHCHRSAHRFTPHPSAWSLSHNQPVRIKPNRFRPPKVPHPEPKSWAERHAPLAQVVAAYSTLAAVIIAGLGYWFTVIPLYQKAAVDEQLARREAELKQLDVELANARREAYELVRSGLLQQTALRASYDCAAFWREDKDTAIDHISRSLTPCLIKASASIVATKRLSNEDGQMLMLATNELAADWEKLRLSLLDKMSTVPSRAANDPTVLAPDGPYTKRVQEFLAKAEPYLSAEDRIGRRQRQFEERVRRTQLLMASDFGVEASVAISKFYRTGIWPAIKLTQ